MSTPPPRRRGRPAVGPELRGVRVDPAVLDRIDAMAEAEATTRAEVVRTLLDEALTARDHRPED